METGFTVGDAMTKKPIVVPKNLTVKDCTCIMRDKDIGSLLIVEGDALLGIMTEYDLTHAVANGVNVQTVPVSEIMCEELIVISPHKDIFVALSLMREHNVRHLPVMEDEELIGFLTLKDILKIQPQLFELLLDKIELREEERKLRMRKNRMSDDDWA